MERRWKSIKWWKNTTVGFINISQHPFIFISSRAHAIGYSMDSSADYGEQMRKIYRKEEI